MPIVRQKLIFIQDLVNNPDKLYVIGSNFNRKNFNLYNVIYISTKWSDNVYFSDKDFDAIVDIIKKELAPVVRALINGKTVIIPNNNFSSLTSQLSSKSPKVFGFIKNFIKSLENSEISLLKNYI